MPTNQNNTDDELREMVKSLCSKMESLHDDMQEFTFQLKEEHTARKHDNEIQDIYNKKVNEDLEELNVKIDELKSEVKNLQDGQKFNVVEWLKNNFIAIAVAIAYFINSQN